MGLPVVGYNLRVYGMYEYGIVSCGVQGETLRVCECVIVSCWRYEVRVYVCSNV